MTSAASYVMMLGSANALLKFGANGLMQSLSGSTTMHRANPLVLIVRLTYSNSKLTPTALYNPLGKSVSATRSGTGVYVITHNLNHTSYTVMGSGLGSGNYCQYVTPYNITASTVTIFTSNNGGYREMSWADVFFYDYRTL